MDEQVHTYILTPIVHPPWGEMQLTIATRAKNWYTAQKQVLEELDVWKRSQSHLERKDFPWLDEAIEKVKAMNGPDAFLGNFDSSSQVHVGWYDEREMAAVYDQHRNNMRH